VTIGVTISFGMLDIVNIAHPAFIMLGSFVVYLVNSNFGIDPILIGVVVAPVFFLVGMAVYQIYFYAFEQRGEESIQGLAFFFGLLFVGEVALILVFGVDYRFVEAPYIGPALHFGVVDLPLRMLVPCLVSLLMLAVLQLFLGRTFIGRAILAVSQDRLALQLMAANPTRIKRIALYVSFAPEPIQSLPASAGLRWSGSSSPERPIASGINYKNPGYIIRYVCYIASLKYSIVAAFCNHLVTMIDDLCRKCQKVSENGDDRESDD
jgi:hypothetical protein